MEFYRSLATKTQESFIHQELTIANLEVISNELFVIGDQYDSEANIGGIWGEFTLIRTLIKGGVRFALKECPNALAWTITTGLPPNPDVIVVHLTINRQNQKPDFIEEINEFLDDHCNCLQAYFE